MPRLFLIEGDRDLAECLSRILASEGFDIEWAVSVESALSIIASKDKPCPDAAVVDLHDGRTVNPDDVLTLRNQLGELPILVTANYHTPEIACKALGKGAREYLLKPFGTREFLERVRKLTGREEPGNRNRGIEVLSDAIRNLASVDDTLKVALDQLSSTLRLTDCLIALKHRGLYRVRVCKGYRPDQTGRSFRLPEVALRFLTGDPVENVTLTAQAVRAIESALSLAGHRPFPTLMPLNNPDGPGELVGFVMGHGGLILSHEDLLEMERFLAQLSREIEAVGDEELLADPAVFDKEGEFRIPEHSRSAVVNYLVTETEPYLACESDSFWIRLALDEAINNAIVHGHNELLEKPLKPVVVRFAIGPGKLVFVVEDTGDGFDYTNLPDPTAEENLLNVNGRGVFLMRQIMDEVIFNDKGNRVTMVKVLDGCPLSPFPGGPENEMLPS